jgi:hypothetical protein
MAKKYESKWNIDKLTNADIYAAIRDLKRDPRSATALDDNAIFLICISLWIQWAVGYDWVSLGLSRI